MRNKALLYIICLLIAIGGVSPAFGQIRYGQPTAGQLKFTYSHWKIENGDTATTIDQMSFPVSGFLPLKDNLEMHLFFAGATNNVDNDDGDISLSGLGDMRLQVNQSLANDQWLISVGMNLPTGKKSLNPAGKQILSVLSENYLSFPVRRLGGGFGFNMLLATAKASGNTRYGGGIMYQFNGTYEPYEGTGDYNPGDMISANAGVDIVSDPTVVSVDVIYSLFTEDKIEGNKVFKQSPLLDLRLGVLRKMGSSSASLRLRYAMRGDNKWYNSGSQEVISSLQLFGNEFLLAHEFRQQALAHAVVELVCPGMIEILSLEVDPASPGQFGKPLRKIHRGRTALVVLADGTQLGNELVGFRDQQIGLGDLPEMFLEFRRKKSPAVLAEKTLLIGMVSKIIRHETSCTCRRNINADRLRILALPREIHPCHGGVAPPFRFILRVQNTAGKPLNKWTESWWNKMSIGKVF